ncbi:MAG: class I SAM-dependent methyltransferase [Alphaproteobacteria bacterium]
MDRARGDRTKGDRDRAEDVPASIGGFPTVVEVVDPDGLAVELVVVSDLESRLDRRRLLADEDYVPPYWALVWSGSIELARRLGREIPCRGRRVLDVGCGLGLPALVTAREGAVVTAVDLDPVPIDFLRASAARLGLPVDARVADLEAASWPHRFDLVLCAELLYERDRFPAMAAALDAALAPGGTIAVADAHRIDTAGFWAAMACRGFEVGELGHARIREEATLVEIRLATLRRRGGAAEVGA